MKRTVFWLIFLILVSSIWVGAAEDHSEMIEGPFDSPQEVTATCLMCHEEVAADIMKTQHWTWLSEEFEMDGQKDARFGKQNMLNNFCVAVSSNWPRCTSCHIGYGWEDDSFDFTNEENIDCLVCHDQTGTYKKTPTGAGMPADDVDLVAVARSVGNTTRQNCGACHFEGGGGNGVKHGDLDESLLNPTGEIDVHMGEFDFSCTECHVTEDHQIPGASHASMASGTNHFDCTSCHDSEPHEKEKLNNHTAAVACQTCHIPAIARTMPTKTWWDWSTAGRDLDVQKDEHGKEMYNKKKGTFKWEVNVVPSYAWFNGKASYYHIGDPLAAVEVVPLNTMQGDIQDEAAKIYPFKVMKGKQMYDTENNYLIVPKLFGEGGFWKTYDWDTAFENGMESVGLEYSGSYDFVKTELYVPIHHMVAPADNSLKCYDCHHKTRSIMDWEALGYPGDPMSEGSRAKLGFVGEAE